LITDIEHGSTNLIKQKTMHKPVKMTEKITLKEYLKKRKNNDSL